MKLFQKLMKDKTNKEQQRKDTRNQVEDLPDSNIPTIQVMGKNANEYIPLAPFCSAGQKPNWSFDFLNNEEFLRFTVIYKRQGMIWRKLPEPENIVWTLGHRELFQKAFDLFEKRQYQESINGHLEYLQYNPIGKTSRLEIATCYLNMGKPDLALETLKTLYPLYCCKDAAILRRLGYTLFDLKDYRSSWICNWASLKYEDSPIAKKEIIQLFHILNESKGSITPDQAVEQVPSVVEKYGFTDLRPEQFYIASQ